MAMDDIFDGIDEILEQAQQNGDDPNTDSDTDTGDIHDYIDDEGTEVGPEDYEDGPEDDSDDEFQPPMSEEELLMNHQQASIEWRDKVDQGMTDLDEQEYVMQATGCTEEEFENRDQIIKGLTLDIAEVIDYDEIPEDVIASIASLDQDAQTQLAEDIKIGKVLPDHLTRPFVLGYQRSVDEPQDGPEDEEEPAEEATEPVPEEEETDELEQELQDAAPEEPQAEDGSEEEPVNPQAYVPESEESDDDFWNEEDSAPEDEAVPEDTPVEPNPESEETPVEESEPVEEPERTPTMEDPQTTAPTESAETTAPQKEESVQNPVRRGFMSEKDFEPLFESFSQCEQLVRETAGSAVTESDYRGMMTDIQDLNKRLSNIANYYLDNALYPFSFEVEDN